MTNPIDQLDLDEAQLTAAYIYVLGRYLVIRQEHLDLAEDGVDHNVLKHNPPIVPGSDSGDAPTFVNPNLDVAYSEAWIAVDADTPAILTIPEVPDGRYFTAQIVDEWAEILHNVNARNFPDHPSGRFAICLAGSDPHVPADCVRIDIPTHKAKLLARVQLGDDLDRAVAIQHGLALESTGSPSVPRTVPIEPFTNQDLPGAWMFEPDRLAEALSVADACPRAGDVLPAVQAVAAFARGGEGHLALLDEALRRVAIPGFLRHLAAFSVPVDGWGCVGNRPNFGDDWGFRTTANYAGIWWNSALEVIYYGLTPDGDGNWPDGSGRYTIRFGRDAQPSEHAEAFWSLTLYSHPDMYLVPNAEGRFSIGPRSDLVRDPDGGFTVHLAPTLPDGAPAENWLPTPPDGRFTLMLRLYLPTPDVAAGSWNPPPMIR